MKGIANRVAIVTGGAGGIGAGLARAFVAAGAKVVTADVLEEQGSALAQELGYVVTILTVSCMRALASL